MESSGGLVAGDENVYHFHIGDRCAVCLIPQSATKVYPSYNGLCSTQHMSVYVADNARLEWQPEALIPFQQSRFNGKTKVVLEPTSTLLWGEIVAPGREKSGECFSYDELRLSLEVWVHNDCVAYDALNFNPQAGLARLGVLEAYGYIGSIWFISPAAQSVDVTHIREWLSQTAAGKDPLTQTNATDPTNAAQTTNMKVAVTRMQPYGIHVRWLAKELWQLKAQMQHMYDFFRRHDGTP
jgi:urease accessory protein